VFCRFEDKSYIKIKYMYLVLLLVIYKLTVVFCSISRLRVLFYFLKVTILSVCIQLG